MFTILFSRTFLLVGGMILITAIAARANKTFETKKEMWITFISTFVFLFLIQFFADFFPQNIILVAIFSALIGWQIGPIIELYGKQFKLKKFLKVRNIILKKKEKLSKELLDEFEKSLVLEPQKNEWNIIVYQALIATAVAVLATASMVFLTSINFSFLGGFLFITLLILVVMGLLNIFFFHSSFFSLVSAYIGVILFTLYLLYDFDRLEKFANDQTWSTAITIAVNISLDIINLFLDILQILGSTSSD